LAPIHSPLVAFSGPSIYKHEACTSMLTKIVV
jgi:hypothetical protein